MGLFKKAKNKTKIDKIDDVEILDFDNNLADTQLSPNERKKENRILFTILIVFVIVVFLLPTLTSIFKKNSIPFINKEVDKVIESG